VKTIIAIILFFNSLNVFSQDEFIPKLVGGTCEGCEAVFEFGDEQLSSIDTLPDFKDNGLKIKLTGTIFLSDGKSPAKDVILYIYHTDQDGIYPTKGNETGWAKRHGYIRGWIKTEQDGQYNFYTLKPGTYPNRSAPAHIHPVILEPEGKYYWIEEFLFEDDPLLVKGESIKISPRCGDGYILTLKKDGDVWIGERNIILGKNVPGYN
jgi:protocatechuate 3,4-dioxygenase beta subunit